MVGCYADATGHIRMNLKSDNNAIQQEAILSRNSTFSHLPMLRVVPQFVTTAFNCRMKRET
jgi:hypothetical protein